MGAPPVSVYSSLLVYFGEYISRSYMSYMGIDVSV